MPYKVFLRAPTFSELKTANMMRWKTIEGTGGLQASSASHQSAQLAEVSSGGEWILPQETISAASQRISDMYKNVIFNDLSGAEGQEGMDIIVDATQHGIFSRVLQPPYN